MKENLEQRITSKEVVGRMVSDVGEISIGLAKASLMFAGKTISSLSKFGYYTIKSGLRGQIASFYAPTFIRRNQRKIGNEINKIFDSKERAKGAGILTGYTFVTGVVELDFLLFPLLFSKDLNFFGIYFLSQLTGSSISGAYEIGRCWYSNAKSRLEENYNLEEDSDEE
jgi:hypothetical protein